MTLKTWSSLFAPFCLVGCAASMHPDFQNVYIKYDVSEERIQAIRHQFSKEGLRGADVTRDALGRVQLVGTYSNEREVERALQIARTIVGDKAVSNVWPEGINQRRWEISASEGLAKFIERLARKYDMSVSVGTLEISLNELGSSKLSNAEVSRSNLLTAVFQEGLNDTVQFETNSNEPTGKAAQFYREIAQEIVKQASIGANPKLKRILIVGHTDDTGDTRYNAALSERRARAVGKIFEDAGVDNNQIFYQGAGETLPIGDNRTLKGRAQNRRVEILDLTDENTFLAYLNQRRPVLSYYRNTKPSQSAPPAAQGRLQEKSAPTVAPAPPRRQPMEEKKLRSEPIREPEFDFGGQLAGKQAVHLNIGQVAVARGFSIFPRAQADEPIANACTEDRPRVSNGVKSLKDGKVYSTGEYLPGTYDSSWSAIVNGHLVALTHVAVLRDGGVPARRPELLLFRNYSGDVEAKPGYIATPEVNTYRGDKALLYRVFAGGPVQCLDVVIPNARPTEAPGSALYYDRTKATFFTFFNPKLAK
jgi:outer membrane protein OmpA-like peptidoglycan-associated protein